MEGRRHARRAEDRRGTAVGRCGAAGCFGASEYTSRFRTTDRIATTPFSTVYGCCRRTAAGAEEEKGAGAEGEGEGEGEGELVVKVQSTLATRARDELRILRHLRRHENAHAPSLVFAEVGLWRTRLVFLRVRGPTLDVHVARAREQGTLDAARLMRRVLTAFQSLHAHRVVHRDIKYGNIMVDERSQQIKVLDYGLSVVRQDLRANVDNAVAGTLQYQPPEMFRGTHYNGSCDTWSLGVLFHHLATGRFPYAVSRREACQCAQFRLLPEGIRALAQPVRPLPLLDAGDAMPAAAAEATTALLGRMLRIDGGERPLLEDLAYLT
jgi:serine/threonine protein kinase